MHEMLIIITDVYGACRRRMQCTPRAVCAGHSVQPSPNAFGLLFSNSLCSLFFCLASFLLISNAARGQFYHMTSTNAKLHICSTAASHFSRPAKNNEKHQKKFNTPKNQTRMCTLSHPFILVENTIL